MFIKTRTEAEKLAELHETRNRQRTEEWRQTKRRLKLMITLIAVILFGMSIASIAIAIVMLNG